jgi:hypothetical protein
VVNSSSNPLGSMLPAPRRRRQGVLRVQERSEGGPGGSLTASGIEGHLSVSFVSVGSKPKISRRSGAAAPGATAARRPLSAGNHGQDGPAGWSVVSAVGCARCRRRYQSRPASAVQVGSKKAGSWRRDPSRRHSPWASTLIPSSLKRYAARGSGARTPRSDDPVAHRLMKRPSACTSTSNWR